MVPAQIAVNIRRNIRYLAAFVAIILLVAALVGPQETWAATGGPQECTASSTCTIGEFLYDDN